MANNNTYTWQFPAIDVYKQQGTYTDVVYNIHWQFKGVDQSTSHSAEIYGVQSVPAYNPASGSFVPFENLTQQLVTGWVVDALGGRYGQITASIDATIQEKINPPTKTLPPPW